MLFLLFYPVPLQGRWGTTVTLKNHPAPPSAALAVLAMPIPVHS